MFSSRIAYRLVERIASHFLPQLGGSEFQRLLTDHIWRNVLNDFLIYFQDELSLDFGLIKLPNASLTFTSNNINVAALDKVFTFNKVENSKVVETQTSGYMNFYVPAKDGAISSKKVQYVDLASNYFITADGIKYQIKGSSDIFRNESVAIFYESFKAVLNNEDTIMGTYKSTSGSSFNVTTNHYSVPLLIDSKFAYKYGYGYRMIGKQIELKGTGQPNYELFLFKNSGSILGKIKINSAGTWKFNTNLEQNAINDFYMVQQVAGKATPFYTSGSILRVIEGSFDLLSISDGSTEDEDLTSEEITFTNCACKADKW